MISSRTVAPETEVVDALRLAWRERWVVLAFTALGCALAALALFVKTPVYEASAIVRIAQVGKAGGGESVLVESQAQAIARFRIPTFLMAAQLEPGLSFEQLGRYVDVTAVRGTEALDIRYRAATPDTAKLGARKLFDLLASRHADLAKPAVEALQRQLAQAERLHAESLERRQRILEKLPSLAAGSVKDQYPFLDAAFVVQDVEIAKWQSFIRDAMVAPSTLPTRLVETISVSDRPVEPRPLRYWAAGVIGGGLLGLLAAFAHDARRRRRRPDNSTRVDA